jgi:hypothetical protein
VTQWLTTGGYPLGTADVTQWLTTGGYPLGTADVMQWLTTGTRADINRKEQKNHPTKRYKFHIERDYVEMWWDNNSTIRREESRFKLKIRFSTYKHLSFRRLMSTIVDVPHR